MLANTIFEVIGYLEKPILEEDKNDTWKYRIKKLLSLLFIVVTVNVCVFSILMIYQVNEKTNFDEINHIGLDSISNINFFIFSICINPLITETIFRGFLHKAKKNFIFFFYISAILFGFFQSHYSYNFHDTIFLGVLLFFLTQFFLGLILGFTRIRYGFLWSYTLNVLTYIVCETILLSYLFL